MSTGPVASPAWLSVPSGTEARARDGAEMEVGVVGAAAVAAVVGAGAGRWDLVLDNGAREAQLAELVLDAPFDDGPGRGAGVGDRAGAARLAVDLAAVGAP